MSTPLTTNPDQIFKEMRAMKHVFPESAFPNVELKLKADLIAQIRLELARRGDKVVVLKHNYMEPALYAMIPGIAGDSLALARAAAQTTADTIIFCGVRFMAQTAKILNPTKQVFIPTWESGCSLADGINAETVRWLKQMFPGLPVVTYINSYSEVKAESDVCCTSGNVEQVIRWAMKEWGTKSVIFVPDQWMAGNMGTRMGMQVFVADRHEEHLIGTAPDYTNTPTIITWGAGCYVHELYTPEHVQQIRANSPGAMIIAHPECKPEVTSLVDMTGSTSEMEAAAQNLKPNQMLALLTECSMADNILSKFPHLGERLVRMCNMTCRFMKRITLEQLLYSLQNDQYEITVSNEVRQKSLLAVTRMLAIK